MLLRSASAGLFFVVVLGALIGSACDLQIPYADLAYLERLPESDVAMPGATSLFVTTEDHRLNIDGPEPSSIRRTYGTSVAAGTVNEFYARTLNERGWVITPSAFYVDDAVSTAWCYGDAQLQLHIADPAKVVDTRYPVRFATLLMSADNHTWRSLGIPCREPFPSPLREADGTLAVTLSIAVFFIAAQLTRQRALAIRGSAEARAAGLAGLAAYFLWVPYLVVWQRYGPSLPLPETVRWAAVALVVGGVAFALWAMFTLGRHYDLEVELHHGHELVRRGPFRLVRHPLYTGLAVHFIGACVATGNVLLIAGTLLVTFPAFYVRARSEERLLRDRFGAEYESYAREVPMLIPFTGALTRSR